MTIEQVSDVDAVLGIVERMSVGDLVRLTKAVRERFGIADAPTVDPRTVPADVAPPPEPEVQTEFGVLLEEAGPNKVQTIKVVRGVTWLGLREAKDWTDKLPRVIVADLPRPEAEGVVAKFAAVGARASVV